MWLHFSALFYTLNYKQIIIVQVDRGLTHLDGSMKYDYKKQIVLI